MENREVSTVQVDYLKNKKLSSLVPEAEVQRLVSAQSDLEEGSFLVNGGQGLAGSSCSRQHE